VKKILIAPIRFWQIFISSNMAPRCKYFPSCSQYTIDAINAFGFKGLFMGAWRILRCNPWSHGGVDYAGGIRVEYSHLKQFKGAKQ
jgi:putative membrane protein insertion efficiency factor